MLEESANGNGLERKGGGPPPRDVATAEILNREGGQPDQTPPQDEISASAITATKTLSGTRCVDSRWRRTVKTAAAMITAPSASPAMRLTGSARERNLNGAHHLQSASKTAPPARVAPPSEIALRRGRADRIKEACAKEAGNEEPDRKSVDHLSAHQSSGEWPLRP
jgi:hypothetical protein